MERRPIPGASRYWVTAAGEIVSVARGRERVLRQTPVGAGYANVCVAFDDGRVVYTSAHRIVAFAWYGVWSTRDNQVRHKNHNKLDNRPDNLEFGTSLENIGDNVRDMRHAHGERVNTANLTAEQVIEIRTLAASGVKQKDIAARFGTPTATINHIVVGRTWKHLTPELQTHKGYGRLSEEQRLQFTELRASGVSTVQIAAMFGVSPSHVSRISRGLRGKNSADGSRPRRKQQDRAA